MATTVTGFTADRMLEIENTTVVDGSVVGDDLILTTREGTDINAGNVRGPAGPSVPPSGAAGGELAGTYPNPTLSGNLASARVFTWGVDTTLYRSAADILKTDDQFQAALNIRARAGGAAEVQLGDVGPASESGIKLGSLADTNLYRGAADVLKTDDAFQSVLDISARKGGANEVVIGTVSANPGIQFGSGGDANLYRLVANALMTNAALNSALAITANLTQAYQVYMGISGPSTQPGLKLGSAGDTNIYRDAADTLKTDDNFKVGSKLEVSVAGDYIYSLAGYVSLDGGGGLKNALRLGSTTLNTGITIGGDTNLFRSAVDTLSTDDKLTVGLDAFIRNGAAAEIRIGGQGPASEAGIRFGTAQDTNLYRSAADTLKTDDALQVVGALTFAPGTVNQIRMSGGYLEFGTTADVNLYRSAADTLKTDDNFKVGSYITLNAGGGQINAQFYYVDNGGLGITFGSGLDTNLYRGAADQLKTDDAFYAVGNIRTDGFADIGGASLGAYLDIRAALAGVPGIRVAGLSAAGSPAAILDAYLTAADANANFVINRDGKLQWGLGGVNAIDTSLTRAAAGILFSEKFASDLETVGRYNQATATTIGQAGPSSEPGIKFGSAADTLLYRSAAGVLKTNSQFIMSGSLFNTASDSVFGAASGSGGNPSLNAFATAIGRAALVLRGFAGQTANIMDIQDSAGAVMTSFGPTGALLFGATGDTSLFRNAASDLRLNANTDFSTVGGDLYVRRGSANEVKVTDIGGSKPGIKLGSAGDTNLYRLSAGVLQTDGRIYTTGYLYAAVGANNQIILGYDHGMGSGTKPAVSFGTNGDAITKIVNGLMAIGAGTTFTAPTMTPGLGDALMLGNLTTAPSTNAVGGGLLYSEAGGIKHRGTSGGIAGFSPSLDGLIFGSVGDTNLYRSAADTLKTDDAFIAAGLTTDGRYTNLLHANAELLLGAAGDVSIGRPGVANILRLGDGDMFQLGSAVGGGGGGFIEYWEQTADPAAGVANTARLFAKDNGAGKTQLCVRFNTGAVQVIATEP